MTTRRWQSLAVLATAVVVLPAARSQPADEAARKEADRIAKWEPQISAFEKQDAAKPTPPGGIVFTGSSTIRLWDLAKGFPDLAPLNRGFGGSHLADVRAYLPRLVLKHKPRLVVIRAGGNDLAAGKLQFCRPDQVTVNSASRPPGSRRSGPTPSSRVPGSRRHRPGH